MGATTQLTAEEYLNLPDYPGKQELLDGELISLPPAKLRHSEIARRFIELLHTVLEKSRVRFFEGYQLKRGWLIPDVSVNWPDQPVGDWYLGSPMIAIEIVSRGNSAEEIDHKIDAYLEEGAAEIWAVYPKTHSMTVYRKGETLRVTGIYRCEIIGLSVNTTAISPLPIDESRAAAWP